MTEERVSPLRQRMIEDMNIRGTGEKTQKAHIRNVKHFTAFRGRSPDTATPEELRSYQLKMTKDGATASTFNLRIISLRFFFGVTCGREEMKRYMQFHRKPCNLPIVLSVEEVANLLAVVTGPGLKYRAALGISYGAGLRVAEVCHLKVRDIDSDRMLIHVDDPTCSSFYSQRFPCSIPEKNLPGQTIWKPCVFIFRNSLKDVKGAFW
jgi:site-specific recombinase XerD